jgi:hypothetical protein
VNPENERVAAEYPALKHLARAYFHQDFDLDYDAPEEAVDDFLDGSPDVAPHVAAEVERALTEFPSEEETKSFLLWILESSYMCERDGITYRDWLRSVAERACAAGF